MFKTCVQYVYNFFIRLICLKIRELKLKVNNLTEDGAKFVFTGWVTNPLFGFI